jgi:hypothetical protein
MRPAEKFLLGRLIGGSNDDGRYRIGIKALAKYLGLEYRTVRAAAIRLEALGLISIKATGKASVYTVNQEVISDWHKCATQETDDAQTCQSERHTRASLTGTSVPVDPLSSSLENFKREGAVAPADFSFPLGNGKEEPGVCGLCGDLGVLRNVRPATRCSCQYGSQVSDTILRLWYPTKPEPKPERRGWVDRWEAKDARVMQTAREIIKRQVERGNQPDQH